VGKRKPYRGFSTGERTERRKRRSWRGRLKWKKDGGV